MLVARKYTKIVFVSTVFVALLTGGAIAANEKTNKKFCNQYAESVSSIASEAIKKNSKCLDSDRGVHPSYEHHFNWCMQNTRDTVKGAAKNIRALAKKCVKSSGAASAPDNKKSKNGGERFCKQYSEIIAGIVSDAMKVNSACLDPSRGVHPDVKSHYEWCMKTPRKEVEGADAHIRDLVAACTR